MCRQGRNRLRDCIRHLLGEIDGHCSLPLQHRNQHAIAAGGGRRILSSDLLYGHKAGGDHDEGEGNGPSPTCLRTLHLRCLHVSSIRSTQIIGSEQLTVYLGNPYQAESSPGLPRVAGWQKKPKMYPPFQGCRKCRAAVFSHCAIERNMHCKAHYA